MRKVVGLGVAAVVAIAIVFAVLTRMNFVGHTYKVHHPYTRQCFHHR